MHAYVGVCISQLLRFNGACDRYTEFLARHKRLVRTLLDQGFWYDLFCRKFEQFYLYHHSLIYCYSSSVMQHLREGVDSQVRWWSIRILLVGAAVTGTDRLSIYPFTGVALAFPPFFFFIFYFYFLFFIFPFFSFFFLFLFLLLFFILFW